ncbi:hypothetical protein [uncultured Anaerococcus sp.]|uniref:hypothetical protein n=1 Tax=uncultured Anaerococcus sp. TaxID=293428 RepID=UPI0028898F8D|nr:hypothetical protein [uncultured Anaerococcus sp.]
MKKYLISLLILIFLPACGKENKTTTYTLANIDQFKHDSSLYTGEKLIKYPSPVKKETYTKKDLDNLDYNKEVRVGDIFFRLPDKTEIFKKDDTYFVDFPLDLSYSILLSFKKLDTDTDLMDLAKKIIKKERLNSKPIRNKFTNKDSLYFISEDDTYTYTHFFIKSPNTTLYFVIKEDKTKAGGKIMADILMTSYLAGEDPFEVSKSFEDYKEDLSVFASQDVEFSGLSIKIPENFTIHQEEENFKYFIAKKDNKVIGEIIIKKDKVDGDLYDAYNLNSGDIIYPTQLINMGKTKNLGGILEGEIRLYTKENTLTGKKFVMKRKNTYITIIVVGPIANKSLSISMADSIKESIKK